MSSRSSRRNEIGGAIGDQLRAIYDQVLNEPIADRFFELLDQLETDSKLVVAHQKNTQKFAPPQSTARISRNAPVIIPKSLAGRTKHLEPHPGRQASEIAGNTTDASVWLSSQGNIRGRGGSRRA
ncbi:MAG: NepR family anti-sigma factor [Methylocystis sp.]